MRTFNPAGVDVQYTVDLLHLSYQGHVIYTGTVQYSTVQFSTVQYSTEQYSTVQYSTVQ